MPIKISWDARKDNEGLKGGVTDMSIECLIMTGLTSTIAIATAECPDDGPVSLRA